MSESEGSYGIRTERQREQYPELQVGSPNDLFNVDTLRRRTGQALTSLGRVAEHLWATSSDPMALGIKSQLRHGDRPRGALFAGAEATQGSLVPPLLNPSFYRGAVQGFKSPQDYGGGDLLRRAGWNDTAAGVVGFGLDQALDPMNLLGAAAARKGIGAARALPVAEQQMSGAARALRGAIEQAKPLQELNDEALSAFRSGQVRKFWGAAGRGEAGMRAGLGAMRGQADRATFTPLREALSQTDIDGLFTEIMDSQLRGYDSPTAGRALLQILDGQVPARSELAKLELVFPGLQRVMRETSVIGKPDATKWERVVDTLSLPRTLKATADLSATFRHGAVASVRHPAMASRAFVRQVRAAFDSDYAVALDEARRATPESQLMSSFGRYLSPLDADTAEMTAREEQFISSLAERIPGLGAVVRGSNRAFATYLNEMRHGIEKQVLAQTPEDMRTPERMRFLADWLNHSTGRGDLAWFKDYAPTLNSVFFSPRYAVSLVQRHADAIKAAAQLTNNVARRQALDPVAKEVASSMLAFWGTGLTVLGTMKAAGLEVGLNSDSPNFGKFKVGNTWYDYWGGLAQDARLISNIVHGKSVSGRTGTEYDQRFSTSILNFLRNKLSPGLPTVTADVMVGRNPEQLPLTGNLDPVANARQFGQTFAGADLSEELTPGGELGNQLGFLILGELVSGWQADKVRGALGSGVAGGLGFSSTSYRPQSDSPEAISNEKLLRGGASGEYEDIRLKSLEQMKAIDPNLTGPALRERVGEIELAARAERDRVQKIYGTARRKIETPEEQALTDYYDAVVKLPDGSVDWEATDIKRAQLAAGWTDEQKAHVEKETGTANEDLPPVVRELKQASKDLTKAGWFDLRDRAWQQYASEEGFNGGDDYYTYKAQVIEEWARGYRVEDGLGEVQAKAEAERQFSKMFNPFIKWFANDVRMDWEQHNPELALKAYKYGYLKPSGRDEEQYLDTIARWLQEQGRPQ